MSLVLLLARVALLAEDNRQWPTYGGDPGGSRFSTISQINPNNVARLRVAWSYHTGALAPASSLEPDFEATPILFEGALYVSTPFDQVIALNPETGKELWKFDPRLDRTRNYGPVTSRGVAVWKDVVGGSFACRRRVFVGTIDARLIALDATSGKPCSGFGAGGSVDLKKGVELQSTTGYRVTSPPTVVGNVVVVGSFVSDNQLVEAELGVVRGYDARTGRLLWTWDPIPWARNQHPRTGAANAWSVISADIQRGVLFLPTGSPSPDYYGGLRPGDNKYANSVVALEAATGKFIWGFQTVHHDLWDFDIAAQPLLFTLHGNIPAVAVTTKMGLVFVLDRLTGKPLYSVEERPVPKSDVRGEIASATQPFPSLPSLGPQVFSLQTAWGATPDDLAFCRSAMAGLRWEGMYTPPTLQGTLLFPGNVGGVNWGSAALDPSTGILYANTNRLPYLVKLVPRDEEVNYWELGTNLIRRILHRPTELTLRERLNRKLPRFTGEFAPQVQTPYAVYREAIVTPGGLPCIAPPWGSLSALNLNTGKKAWEVPLGTMIPGQKTGSINLGGPIVTAGGLVFTAASTEPYLRAFDSTSGRELWKGELPVPAQATPMTYSIGGRQYIVICAGGHGQLGTPLGDSVVAFALN